MRSALCLLAASSLVSACAFQGNGRVADGGATIDESPPTVDATTMCAAPIVIDDSFENANLETVGPSSIGDGFAPVTNAAAGNGASDELAGTGLEIRTSNNGTAVAPAHGAASNTSFAFDPAGMTIRLEVMGADTPIWNGIALGLQSNRAIIDGAGGSLVLRIRGQGTSSMNVDMGTQATYAESLGLQPYDEAELANGFVVRWNLGALSWSYVITGLRADGSELTGTGGYRIGETPADLLDETAHLGIHIQGNPDDANPRVLRVKRVTLWNGACP